MLSYLRRPVHRGSGAILLLPSSQLRGDAGDRKVCCGPCLRPRDRHPAHVLVRGGSNGSARHSGSLHCRGRDGGVVVGQVCSLANVFGTEDLWHYALTAYMFLILVCYLPSYLFPESPKFLYIVKGNRAAAKRELQRLRGKDAEELIAQEMAEMEAESNAKVQTSSFCDVLRDPRLTLPLIIVCCFHGGQQLSGINAVNGLFTFSSTLPINFVGLLDILLLGQHLRKGRTVHSGCSMGQFGRWLPESSCLFVGTLANGQVQ